jgi:hypothetical protein
MATRHKLGMLLPATAVALFGLALAHGCAATDVVAQKGQSGSGGAAGSEADSAAGGATNGGTGGSIGIDAMTDAPIGETCAAADAAESTYGCEFFTLQVDTINDTTGGYGLPGACFAAFVANRGIAPVKIEVDRDGVAFTNTDFIRIPSGEGKNVVYGPYDPNVGLPPNQVAIVFLSQGTPPKEMFCPEGTTTAVSFDAAVHGTGLGKAFHIKTSAPVTAYQMFPYGGGHVAATSATLLMPISAWGKNYVAINAYKASELKPEYIMPSLDIVASEDDTTVKLDPKAAILPGPGVVGAAVGQVVEYQLDRGQYVQFTQQAEITGSIIEADKPIGVFGGATCINVPANKEACDTAQQQLLPIQKLGHQYVAVRYKPRHQGLDEVDESVPWRLIGAVDGTTLSYLPAPPPGAPLTINKGELVEFWTKDPFIVQSSGNDQPFYLGAYMTGGAEFLGEGDPEWVNVVPTSQYLDSYVFFTDPTYPETSLVVIRKKDENGVFQDVTLECKGKLTDWTPVGDYEFSRVSITTGHFESVDGCNNGRQMMESPGPFTVTVWGWGSITFGPTDFYSAHVSYAYPAGMGTKLVNDVKIPVVK